MEQIIQITPEAVKEAYEKTELKPRQICFYDDIDNCGCALTALVMDRDKERFFNRGVERLGVVGLAMEYTGLNRDQLWSFVSGFDNCETNFYGHEDMFQLGKDVAKVIFPEVSQ